MTIKKNTGEKISLLKKYDLNHHCDRCHYNLFLIFFFFDSIRRPFLLKSLQQPLISIIFEERSVPNAAAAVSTVCKKYIKPVAHILFACACIALRLKFLILSCELRGER